MITGQLGKVSPKPDWEPIEVRILETFPDGTARVLPTGEISPILFGELTISQDDFQPLPLSVEVAFDVAHDLIAFGDCYCGSEKPFAGARGTPDQCIHHALLKALFAATGNPMYAEKEGNEDGTE